MCANFQEKRTNLSFLSEICPKLVFGSESQKSKYRFGLTQFKRPCALFSVELANFHFFDLNLEKLTNYVQYFGSNNFEDVAESWVETELSWVEVDIAGWR